MSSPARAVRSNAKNQQPLATGRAAVTNEHWHLHNQYIGLKLFLCGHGGPACGQARRKL